MDHMHSFELLKTLLKDHVFSMSGVDCRLSLNYFVN